MDSRTQLLELQRHWTPPDGLELCRSRQVRLTALGKIVFAVAVALFVGALAAGIALGLLANRQADERRLLRAQGADTQGRVTRLWRSGDKGREWRVAYEIAVQGRTFSGQAELPPPVWAKLQVGSDLAVRYLPANPALSHPLGREPERIPMWVPWLVAAALAGAGGLVTFKLQRQRWLLEQGRPAPAVVTRHRKTDKGTLVYYEFLALSGSLAKGRHGPTRKPPAIGATFCGFYDPDDLRRSAPYPFRLVEPVFVRRIRKGA